MFRPGEKVVCVNPSMGNIGEILVRGKIYTVKEFLSLEEYEKRHPDCGWWLKGAIGEEWKDGVLHLEESLGADESDLDWVARRFKPA